MNFLEGVQELHREAKLPGAPPSTVVGQTGRAADLVAWYREAYNDIQREKDGKWRWLLKPAGFSTTAGDASYLPSNLVSPATRWRSWYLDPNDPPLIRLGSEPTTSNKRLTVISYGQYRSMFISGHEVPSTPTYICEAGYVTSGGFKAGVGGSPLLLGPPPNDIYAIGGLFYWQGNQILAADADTPEMPSDYHMTIVYRAIIKYGYNAVAREVLSRAGVELPPIYDALVLNQAWSRFSMSLGGPLA